MRITDREPANRAGGPAYAGPGETGNARPPVDRADLPSRPPEAPPVPKREYSLAQRAGITIGAGLLTLVSVLVGKAAFEIAVSKFKQAKETKARSLLYSDQGLRPGPYSEQLETEAFFDAAKGIGARVAGIGATIWALGAPLAGIEALLKLPKEEENEHIGRLDLMLSEEEPEKKKAVLDAYLTLAEQSPAYRQAAANAAGPYLQHDDEGVKTSAQNLRRHIDSLDDKEGVRTEAKAAALSRRG